MSEWISVNTEMPEAGKNVLLRQDAGSAGYSYTVVGRWIPKFTEESGSDSEWFEWNEEEQVAYTPEGFYEQQLNWDEYGSIHINEKVTHWMPLPEPPEAT